MTIPLESQAKYLYEKLDNQKQLQKDSDAHLRPQAQGVYQLPVRPFTLTGSACLQVSTLDVPSQQVFHGTPSATQANEIYDLIAQKDFFDIFLRNVKELTGT